MTLQPVLHPAAEQELREALGYYANEVEGLDARFMEAIEKATSLLCVFPNLARALDDQYRAYPLKKFPYSLVYRVLDDRLLVVAVAHQKRREGYWRGRV